ncbi:Ser/Thr protein kinase RdoA involved in Cpx stress response, MazF antagonist [Virgibacillus subterraneus]|uniref:Ser/Thr protein kinase RdoA involved in Cpx stress response, MazF antagonist n=1 Tax=Virgibacillus subterraneus TaxID=621109 RepID=A0A1H9FKL5_9BACI|nr:phosphotransferase [Virgibacillus subterraneus]SEQ38454.1 Ser/Thr protein kinase RdoA involved in Cpx stress response, MazF antagonist [Virgibacillus subterraneus]
MDIQVRHSLIHKDSILQIIDEHDIEALQCDFLARGLNDTYLITTEKETYIYRLYRTGWRDREAILFELDAINHLQGDRVSFPIKKKDGNYLTEVKAPEGVRYGVLFSYSKGERPQINVENSKIIGETLGRLHNKSDKLTTQHERGFELDTEHLLDEQVAVISPILKKCLGNEAEETLHIVVENIKTDLTELNLETGFCHGDFHNHNMHIHDGVIEVFDFDCCAMGYRAYDVAVSWWNLKNNYKNIETECWDAFLKGYLEERKLADDDLKSLPLFITARRIWLLGTMLRNDDVWGTNWINSRSLELFIWQLKTDRLGDEDI